MRVYQKTRYLIYNEKEELIFEGTADECAERLNVTKQSFYTGICKKTKFHRKYEVIKDDFS